MRDLKLSTARNVAVFMTSTTDHLTGKTGLTLTINQSKNGAAFAAITPTVTELASGWYNLALTSGHTDTLGDMVLNITGTGADNTDLLFQVNGETTGALTATERTSTATALLDSAAGIETGITPRQGLRVMLAALAGKLSGAATTTVNIRDTNDTVNRIAATVDSDGNRSAITLNLT